MCVCVCLDVASRVGWQRALKLPSPQDSVSTRTYQLEYHYTYHHTLVAKRSPWLPSSSSLSSIFAPHALKKMGDNRLRASRSADDSRARASPRPIGFDSLFETRTLSINCRRMEQRRVAACHDGHEELGGSAASFLEKRNLVRERVDPLKCIVASSPTT